MGNMQNKRDFKDVLEKQVALISSIKKILEKGDRPIANIFLMGNPDQSEETNRNNQAMFLIFAINRIEYVLNYADVENKESYYDLLGKLKKILEVVLVLLRDKMEFEQYPMLLVTNSWVEFSKEYQIFVNERYNESIIVEQFKQRKEAVTKYPFVGITPSIIEIGADEASAVGGKIYYESNVVFKAFEHGFVVKGNLKAIKEFLDEEERNPEAEARLSAIRFLNNYRKYVQAMKNMSDWAILLLYPIIKGTEDSPYIEFQGQNIELKQQGNFMKGIYKEYNFEVPILVDQNWKDH